MARLELKSFMDLISLHQIQDRKYILVPLQNDDKDIINNTW